MSRQQLEPQQTPRQVRRGSRDPRRCHLSPSSTCSAVAGVAASVCPSYLAHPQQHGAVPNRCAVLFAGKVKPVTFAPGVTSQYIMEGLVGAFTYSLGGGALAGVSAHRAAAHCDTKAAAAAPSARQKMFKMKQP